MGFTSAGTHTSIVTTTGSQCCLIMADKDGCISSQSTLCPILIQCVPNTPHAVDPFPHKRFSSEYSRFFAANISAFLRLHCCPSPSCSVLTQLCYYTNAQKYSACTYAGWKSVADHRSPSRPNNHILSTNI